MDRYLGQLYLYCPIYFYNFAHGKTIKYHKVMNENRLKVDKELEDSMTFFCEGLQINAEPNDLLERYDHYFRMYCNHFALVLNTWYDLRIANRDAQVYLMMQPPFVQLVVTPYDYMRYIDCLDGIVTIYQRSLSFGN
jgi:hypothetical protein